MIGTNTAGRNRHNNLNGMNVLGSIQMLGIMNSLKTGDPTVDTVLAMLLPILMGMILDWLHKQKDYLLKLFRKPISIQKTYKRTVAYQAGGARPGMMGLGGEAGVDDESYNHLLIKAIGLYIHSCCKLNMDEADLKLTTIGTDRVMDDEDQFVQNNSRNKTTSTGQLLKQCQIIKQPIKQYWHTVGVFDGASVRVFFEESAAKKKDNNDDGSGNKDSGGKSMKLQLESTGKTSIDTFIDTAYQWYKDELKKLENDNRYLYDFCSMNGNRQSRLTPVYTRYLLGEGKSFDNLFCRKQTTALLKMVDEFQTKGGRYGIPGFPHKLGILLHGKPGTGKTSLIKALAKYTKRQIVTVPLSRITSNHGLMAVMFNKVCTVAGLQKAVKLGQEDVIFVLEDVDAASDVVKRRDLIQKKVVEPPKTDDKTAKSSTVTATASASRTTPIIEMPDALSLAGLLNALDGIVDTPGRIVIMTTNHPEMLDPALVRPGRIDKNIELGDMELDDCKDMMEHYFRATLSDTQTERLRHLFVNKCLEITPAEVEQLIMAEPSVETMIQKLEERVTPVPMVTPVPTPPSSDDGSAVVVAVESEMKSN